MARELVTINIPFEVLTEVIKGLSLEDKWQLADILQEQIDLEEIELEEQNPRIQAKIRQAIADYEAGNYVTIEQYLAQKQKKVR